ncbi:hypothetical protein [Wielerella bovis]|uniref:hypothetical protein n=1 Tax=Wielerella bovis TaxID=2917790 RepID=UPI0020187C3D|nr:hypothetical protein [Wielerella bovis]MCG7657745.1 hypothetical protein [Wielerella bovis]MCG7659966.1 hypothetical protein [Wielerella bovis]ULJ61111.1 hypothetical protein MIS44_04455 [Wielerella bovis]ULJ68923.1 hypothetical protein MIS45_09150 [Wielerella bovis]
MFEYKSIDDGLKLLINWKNKYLDSLKISRNIKYIVVISASVEILMFAQQIP